MDNLQAAILNFRFNDLNRIIQTRRKNAKFYVNNLNSKFVFVPNEKKNEFNTYHTFVIQVNNRNKLKKYLEKKGIQTSIHYPIPIHLQPAAKKLGYRKGDFKVAEKQARRMLTLPINQFLKIRELKKICNEINNFYEN